MFCTNCGKEVQNDSNFCTSCGSEIQKANNKMGKIIFHRIGRFIGCLIDIMVYIDGNAVGSISNNGILEVPVSIGQHKVLFDLWSGINADSVNVTEEYPNVHVDVELKMGFITNKPKIVNIRNEK